MGPRLFSRGNQLHSIIAISVRLASMGPRLFSRGNVGFAIERRIYIQASMGPRLFSRGNEESRGDLVLSPDRFNGATTFQPWKFISGVTSPDVAILLQWGHDFSAVEIL